MRVYVRRENWSILQNSRVLRDQWTIPHGRRSTVLFVFATFVELELSDMQLSGCVLRSVRPVVGPSPIDR